MDWSRCRGVLEPPWSRPARARAASRAAQLPPGADFPAPPLPELNHAAQHRFSLPSRQAIPRVLPPPPPPQHPIYLQCKPNTATDWGRLGPGGGWGWSGPVYQPPETGSTTWQGLSHPLSGRAGSDFIRPLATSLPSPHTPIPRLSAPCASMGRGLVGLNAMILGSLCS